MSDHSDVTRRSSFHRRRRKHGVGSREPDDTDVPGPGTRVRLACTAGVVVCVLYLLAVAVIAAAGAASAQGTSRPASDGARGAAVPASGAGGAACEVAGKRPVSGPGSILAALSSPPGWDIRQAAGYLASFLVIMTFCMREMWALRCIAIASNVAFITYGYLAVLPPVFLLHVVLLPVNVIRAMQHRRRRRMAGGRYRSASRGLSSG